MKRMRMGIPIALLMLLLSSAASGQGYPIPHKMNVQGVLRNIAGEVVQGPYALTFRLFTAETGGAKLYEETQTVQVNGGLFNVYIGPFTANYFNANPEVWLEIQVAADLPLPRRPVTSVGYAFVAENAKQCDQLLGAAPDLNCTTPGCVSSAEVDFSWAKGKTKGGAAADVDCENALGCISSVEIVDGTIQGADIGTGQVGSTNLASNLSLAGNTTIANLLVTGGLYTGATQQASTLRLTNAGALQNISTINASGQITSTLPDGTAPFVVTSKTRNVNLNADLLDGYDSSYFLNASNLNTGVVPVAQLPIATTTTLGVVMIGSGLGVDGAGTVSNTGVLSVKVNAPLTSTGGQSPLISLPVATSTANGYLSSSDWNTFNNKLALVSVRSSDPFVGNGTTSAPLGMTQASAVANGWLSAADWAAFNAKAPASGSGNYVQIQTTAAQTGGFWVEGTGHTNMSMTAGSFIDHHNSAYYLDPADASIAAKLNGAVGIGTTSIGSGVKLDVSGGNIRTTGQIISTTTTAAPLVVSSTTLVTNLNADKLDGYDASAFAPAVSGTGYIQNQTASAQTPASFWISGTGQVNGNLTAGAFCLGTDCKNSWSQVTGPWTVNGSNIYNSNPGYVGIGTTAPAELFDVGGKTRIVAADGAILMEGTKNTRRGLEWYYGATDRYGLAQASGGNLALYASSTQATSFFSFNLAQAVGTDFTELARITHGGNLGLATTTPRTSIQVGEPTALVATNWPAAMGRGILFGQDSDNLFLGLLDEGSDAKRGVLMFGDNPDDSFRVMFNDATGLAPGRKELIRVQANGYVGIGTTTPGKMLDVAGGVKGTELCIGTDCRTDWATVGTNYWKLTGTSLYPISTAYNLAIGGTDAQKKLTVNGTGQVVGLDNGAELAAKNTAGTYETFLIPRYTDNVTYLNFGSAGLNVRNNGSTSVIYANNGGQVGINTTSPASGTRVHVRSGDLRVDGGDLLLADAANQTPYRIKSYNSASGLWMYPTSTATYNYAQLVLGTDINWDVSASLKYAPGTIGAGAGVLQIGQIVKNNANFTHGVTSFFTNGVEQVRITKDGWLGIGTTSPTTKLDLYGGAITVSGLPSAQNLLLQPKMASGTLGWKLASAGGSQEYFDILASNNTNRFRVNTSTGQIEMAVSAGNVGIGTASPAYKLDVSGTARVTGETILNNFLHVGQSNEIWTDSAGLYFHYRGSGANTYFCNQSSTCNVSISGPGVIKTNNLVDTKDLRLTGQIYNDQMNRVVPFYIRGTGLNGPSPNTRRVAVGNVVHVDGTGRGLTLTILKRSDLSLISNTTYDTYGSAAASDNLATALNGVTRDNLYILTSYDAWEENVTANLKTQFERLGLFNARGTGTGSRRPYAAIFEGANGGSGQRTTRVIEVEHYSDANMPPAEIAGWIVNGSIMEGATPNALTNSIGTRTGVFVAEDGKVGIANAAPTQALDVTGNLNVSGQICQGGVCGSALNYWALSGTSLTPTSTTYNVGIGNTAPTEKLDVTGNVKLSGNLVVNGQATISADASNISIGDLMSGDGTRGLALRAGDVTRMYFPSGGNVGIGTTSPAARLDVAVSPASGVPGIRVTNTATTDTTYSLALQGPTGTERAIGFFTDSTPEWWFGRDNTGDVATGIGFWRPSLGWGLVIRDSGNVGIGTTAPGAKLEVAGNLWATAESTAAAGTMELGCRGTGCWTNANGILGFPGYGTKHGQIAYYPGSNALAFLDSSAVSPSSDLGALSQSLGFTDIWAGNAYLKGNLGVGTASPAGRLDVAGGAFANYLTLRAVDGTNEGGEFELKGAGSYPSWVGDVYQNSFRLHSGGTAYVVMDKAAGRMTVTGQVNGTGGLCMNGDCRTGWASIADSWWTGDNSTKLYPKNNTWKIGIGTTAPVSKLHVDAGILAYTWSTNFGTWRSNATIYPTSRPIGRLLNQNPDFLYGNTTGYYVYNNSGGSAVQISVEADPTAPNSSGYRMKIAYNGGAVSPGFGGYFIAPSRADYVSGYGQYKEGNRYLHRIWANIPVGRNIEFQANAYGNGANHTWLTPTAGTGQWQEYIGLQTIGSGGTFSSAGHWNISGGSGAFNWYVASHEIIGIDEPAAFDRAPQLNVGYKRGVGLNWGDVYATGRVMADGGLCFGTDCRTSWGSVSDPYWTGSGDNVWLLKPGSLGVGVTAPAAKLHVSGGAFFDTAGAAASTRTVTIKSSGQNQIAFGAYPYEWSSALGIQSNGNNRLLWFNAGADDGSYNARVRAGANGIDFYTGGTTTDTGNLALTLTKTALVGVRTTAPVANLHVGSQEASANTTGYSDRLAIQPYGHTGGPWIFRARDVSSSAYLQMIYGAGDTAGGITIHHGGGVGIGTGTNFDAKLEVLGRTDLQNPADQTATLNIRGGAGSFSDRLISFQDSAASTTPWWIVQNAAYDSGAFNLWSASDGNRLRLLHNGQFWVGASNRFFVSSSGQVGVGTATPGAKLDLSGGVGAGADIRFGQATQAEGNTTQNAGTYNVGRSRIWSTWDDNFNISTFDATPNPNWTIGIGNGAGGWSGDKYVFMNASGYFGVGTQSPSRRLTVNGDAAMGQTYLTNSDLYFTKTDHVHTGIGNTAGYAAIENASDYSALMILGRMVSGTRRVRLWDYLEVNGNLDVTGQVQSPKFCIGASCITAWPSGITGSGTTGYLSRWTGASTLGKSALYDDGTNVALGTTAPGARVDIQTSPAAGVAGLRVINTSTANEVHSIRLQGPSNVERAIGFFTDNTPEWWFGRDNNGDVQTGIGFWRSGINWAFVIRDSGNVGVGTSAPAAKFQVAGGAIMPAVGSNASAGLYWPTDPGGGSGDEAFIRYFVESGENTRLQIGINNDADDDIEFYQAGAARMNIYNGNVGIATTTPSEKLQVTGNIKASGYVYGTTGLCIGTDCRSSWPGGSGLTGSGTANYITKWTGGTSLGNSQVVDNGTNVGIGTSAPDHKLHVAGDIRIDTPFKLRFGSVAENSDDVYFRRENPASNQSDMRLYIHDDGADDDRFSIWANSCAGGTCNADGSAIIEHYFTNSGTAWHRNNLYVGGNVGINTTSPAYRLDVNGNSRFSALVQLGSGVGIGFNGGTTYGVGVGGAASNKNSIAVDTVDSGSSSDPLELVYYTGAGVTIGSSGSKYLKAVGLGAGTTMGTTGTVYLGNNSTYHDASGNLVLSGNLYFGNANTRTQWRDNAGLQGNAGAQSGFYETEYPTNFPSGASSWWHLLDVRHSNPANNYAMQFAGSFYDQRFYGRKTNNNASQGWSRFLMDYDVGTTIPAGGSGSYIQNQYSSAQSASLWISGNGRFNGAIVPSAGGGSGNGLYWPENPGGGGWDAAWIRYYVESGENTKLQIGTDNDADDDISFYQAGAERMNIYNGNVGIGVTTPGEKLDVNGAIRAYDSIYTRSDSGYANTYLRTWGLLGDGTIYIEPRGGNSLELTDQWSYSGSLNIGFGTTYFRNSSSNWGAWIDKWGNASFNGNVTISGSIYNASGRDARKAMWINGQNNEWGDPDWTALGTITIGSCGSGSICHTGWHTYYVSQPVTAVYIAGSSDDGGVCMACTANRFSLWAANQAYVATPGVRPRCSGGDNATMSGNNASGMSGPWVSFTGGFQHQHTGTSTSNDNWGYRVLNGVERIPEGSYIDFYGMVYNGGGPGNLSCTLYVAYGTEVNP